MDTSLSNPAVALTTGVVLSINGYPLILDMGNTAYNNAAMTTIITGGPASCTIQLQGTMDGVNWNTIATSTSTTGDTQFSVGTSQFTNLRVNVSAVSGGTNPTIALQISVFPPGTHASSVTGSAAVGVAQRVAPGSISPVTTLNAVTTGTGTTVDFGAAVQAAMFQITANGTVTGGTVAMEVSLDGVTWSRPPNAQFTAFSAGTVANPYVLVTNTTILVTTDISAAFRYARCTVVANVTGGATVTALISGY